MRIFLSYSRPHVEFVQRVRHVLSKQPGVEPVVVSMAESEPRFLETILDALEACEAFACFHSGDPGQIQKDEIQAAVDRRPQIPLAEVHMVPGARRWIQRATPITLHSPSVQERVVECARALVQALGGSWMGYDGVPSRYLFDYEKSIIAEYSNPTGSASLASMVLEGAPDAWPAVRRHQALADLGEPGEALGVARAEDASVGVSARPATARSLTFPEAGPRRRRRFPLERDPHLKVAIVVSGGVAPGTNAVIAQLIERHRQYLGDGQDCTITGYREGFKGLYERQPGIVLFANQPGGPSGLGLDERRHGGSVLPTARLSQLLDPEEAPEAIRRIVDFLAASDTDILYVIGGDGSMRAAHAVANIAREHRHAFSVVTVPKTTDNDVLWVWQSFGFLSSVDRAVDFLIDLGTEVRSNPRLCVVQLFGSDSGFVVAHAALAAGGCTAVLIPEMHFCTHALCDWVTDGLSGLRKARQAPWGLVLMAETAVPIDAPAFLGSTRGAVDLTASEVDAVQTFLGTRRVRGQTPDELRTAGRKIVSGVLQKAIHEKGRYDQYWKSFRVFANEPRHLIRAIPPSTIDVVFGQRLAALAVDAAMAGYTDCMVSQWLTEYVVVPLELVVLGRKRLPQDGIFWRSVLASTGQPPELVCDGCRQEHADQSAST